MGLQISDIFRAQVVFPALSNVERDSIVNTFHFRNDAVAGVPDIYDTIRDVLHDFYCLNGTGTSASLSIMNVMSVNYLKPTIKIYDLGKPEPREAVERIWAGTTGKQPSSAASPYPTEVACVISWRTAVIPPKIGKVGKRGRGRTYIGGLTTSSGTLDGSTGELRPSVQLRHLLATRAGALAGASQPPNANFPQLVVLSTTYAETDVVTGGWVDNAFDTQRRRGPDPTVKTIFNYGGVVA